MSRDSNRGLKLRRLTKIDHGLFIFCFGPWLAYVGHGIFFGFSQVPDIRAAIITWFSWAGVVAISFFIAIVVLVFSRPLSAWLSFVVLAALSVFVFMYPEVRTQDDTVAISSKPTRSEIKLGAAPESKQEHRPARNTPGTNPKALIVASVIQPMKGLTESDIDAELISIVEEHFSEEGRKQYEYAMRERGHKPRDIEFDITSALIEQNGEKLVLTTVRDSAHVGPLSKVLWWVKDEQIVRVACINRDGSEFPIRHGECAAKIEEVFGYSRWMLD